MTYINVGGFVAPGESIATLSTGTLSMAAGSTYELELDVDISGGTSADQINVGGTVDLNGGAYSAGGTDTGANLTFVFVPAFTGAVTPNQTFVIIKNDTNTDAVDGRFVQAPTDDALAGIGNLIFTVDYNYNADNSTFNNGNDIALTIISVPEPSSAIILGALSLGLAARRRRRM